MICDEELVAAAAEMLEKAYAPYSGFRVGAALLAADGQVFTGCNIENASFGATICAERAAVCKAVASGARDFVRLAVVASKGGRCFPCGICRQTLSEFSKDLVVLCAGPEGAFERYTLNELLPNSFSDFREE